MTVSGDRDGDVERDRFAALLDTAAKGAPRLRFWWRDDDAMEVTPALERLLGLVDRRGLPLALAVIPKPATADLVKRLADSPRVSVLQHGWAHANHSPPSEKKMELGNHRPVAAMAEELGQGFRRLSNMFPDTFLPVLVPPWNRIGDAVRKARLGIGLTGLSTFGPAPSDEAHWVNTHLDILDWRARAPLPRAEAYAELCRETERRLGGDAEPLGILTHHLVHQDTSWDFIEELFELTAAHPGTAWPEMPDLFGLPGR